MLRFDVITDKARIDFDQVYRMLNAHAHQPHDIPQELFVKAMANALCFAGRLADEQIAFARIISDFATFAHLADVYVVPEFRGQGYAQRLLTEVFAHPDVQAVRRFTLTTRDAHTLYEKFGFQPPLWPGFLMERYSAEGSKP